MVKMMVSLISSINIYWVPMYIAQPRFSKMDCIVLYDCIIFNGIYLNKRYSIYLKMTFLLHFHISKFTKRKKLSDHETQFHRVRTINFAT